MLLMALPVLIYQAAGSTLGTAFAFLTELVPTFAMTPLATRLAEQGTPSFRRWSRKNVLPLTNRPGIAERRLAVAPRQRRMLP